MQTDHKDLILEAKCHTMECGCECCDMVDRLVSALEAQIKKNEELESKLARLKEEYDGLKIAYKLMKDTTVPKETGWIETHRRTEESTP